MMNTSKKTLLTFVVINVALAVVCSSAFAFSGANDVKMTHNAIMNSIRASFYANRNTGSNPKFGAKANKHIRRCYVRLYQGNYDSGRRWSKEAQSKSDDEFYTAYTSRVNNPFNTAYTNYDWRYFD